MSRITHVLALSVALLAASSAQAQGVDLESALKYVPGSANSLAIVKVQELMNSPRGKKEEWAKKHQSAFLAGSVHVPPAVDYLVRAFEFHPEDRQITSSYGIASFKVPVPMTKLAEHEHGHIQMVAGHPAVLTARNSIFSELKPGLVGVINPGYRQDLARWLHEVDKGPEPTLSPYLHEVARQIGAAQVVLALDFQDLVDPKRWRERIKSSPAVAGKANAVKLLSDLADSLRGVSLKIDVTDKTMATITLDFGTIVSQTAKPFIQPVFVDMLEEAGAGLDDLSNANNVEVTAAGKTATIRFELSDSGLRHVLSMIIMPNPTDSASDVPAPPNPDGSTSTSGDGPTPPTLPASKAYFGAVTQILDDLEAQARKGGNYLKTATWHENFAKKIDSLPLVGVDPDLLDWGGKVSSNLRALAVSLRGVPITVNAIQGGLQYNVQYQAAGYRSSNDSVWSTVAYQPAYVNVETNAAQIRAEQAKAVAAGAQQREQLWGYIASDRQAVRVKLTEKFGKEFGGAR